MHSPFLTGYCFPSDWRRSVLMWTACTSLLSLGDLAAAEYANLLNSRYQEWNYAPGRTSGSGCLQVQDRQEDHR
jgi:hypothetical protein